VKFYIEIDRYRQFSEYKGNILTSHTYSTMYIYSASTYSMDNKYCGKHKKQEYSAIPVFEV
jgi:hypothetical protein